MCVLCELKNTLGRGLVRVFRDQAAAENWLVLCALIVYMLPARFNFYQTMRREPSIHL